MKSLVLKDLYNIGHNVKSMLIVMVMFAVLFSQEENALQYISQTMMMCVVTSGMMIITTFAFDDMSKWNRYALVMPLRKRDVVRAKFISLFVFLLVGMAVGLLLGFIVMLILQKGPMGIEFWKELAPLLLVLPGIGLCYGCCMIPLVFRFGVERARMLTVACIAGFIAVIYAGYRLMKVLGITVTGELIEKNFWMIPVGAVLLCLAMYKISCGIFVKKEV